MIYNLIFVDLKNEKIVSKKVIAFGKTSVLRDAHSRKTNQIWRVLMEINKALPG